MRSSKSPQKLEETQVQPADLDARTRLLDVGSKLFAEKGLHGTSTRDIAKASGLNVSLISYYFGGKEGLYKTVIEEFAQKVSLLLQKILAEIELETMTKESFLKQMKKLISIMVSQKSQSHQMTLIFQREVLSNLPYARNIYENIFSRMADKLAHIFSVAQKKGIVRKDINPHVLVLSMVYATDSYFLVNNCKTSILEKCYRLPEQKDDYVNQIYAVFIEGVTL